MSTSKRRCLALGMVREKQATDLVVGDWCRMDIAYKTRKLRRICLSNAQMKNEFGEECAAALQNFLADVRAAENIIDVLYREFEVGDISDKSARKFDVEGQCDILITANHNRNPSNDKGEVDWTKVTRVQIRKIEQ